MRNVYPEANKVFFLENYPEALKISRKKYKFLKNIIMYEISNNDCFNFVQIK